MDEEKYKDHEDRIRRLEDNWSRTEQKIDNIFHTIGKLEKSLTDLGEKMDKMLGKRLDVWDKVKVGGTVALITWLLSYYSNGG